MKNKQIASYAIISTVVFILSLASGAGNDYADGLLKMVYFASIIGVYTFIIWGWVRLFKSTN